MRCAIGHSGVLTWFDEMEAEAVPATLTKKLCQELTGQMTEAERGVVLSCLVAASRKHEQLNMRTLGMLKLSVPCGWCLCRRFTRRQCVGAPCTPGVRKLSRNCLFARRDINKHRKGGHERERERREEKISILCVVEGELTTYNKIADRMWTTSLPCLCVFVFFFFLRWLQMVLTQCDCCAVL